ncbi:prepilin-type N-terminal cleavage/methylation domain-containing protein [Rhodoferax sp. UBA5149]|uniref:prepilin-type N-terminal cleavage/methylation domain-containing protein n=1 Tax=Rhodoferax sp. UBA5149 TaxID=1947379 RepID=UPI0025CC119E|nr:prepilin-type N-terminal cleavage/methylation domain-containing protein [Rhodoferax sp. UBA5149]
MRQKTLQCGFTIIELIMVIVIMGAIGGMVSVFMKSPIDAYFASARRAALTDVADTTVRRMARDIRKALPNSILNPNNQCLEFIPTKTGGRYRAVVDASGNGDILDFAATAPADGSFDMLGANSTLADQAIARGDLVAVYNLGISDANAYNADNTSAVSSVGAGSLPNETKINIAPMKFPLASGSNRFHVIPKDEKVVAFVCAGGSLYRTARAFAGATCPVTGAILARNVDACNFVYSGSDLQRNALVQLGITFKDGTSNETVSLYHEVHVDNTP